MLIDSSVWQGESINTLSSLPVSSFFFYLVIPLFLPQYILRQHLLCLH